MNRKRVGSNPLRLALYARVSSDKQAQEGTIDSQVSLLRQKIEAARAGRNRDDLKLWVLIVVVLALTSIRR